MSESKSLKDQWISTWNELNVSITPALLHDFDDVLTRYSEPHRKYHTVRHLEECFAKLTEVRTLAQHPAEVEYSWVPELFYRKERRRILNEFLTRASVFNTPVFRERYEQQARENIERSIMRLR